MITNDSDYIRLHKKLEMIYSENPPQTREDCVRFTVKEIYPIITGRK